MIISNTTQPPMFQYPTIPPIPISSNTTITTQPQSHTTQTSFPPNPSLINPNSPSSLPMPHNLFTSQPSTSNPPHTSFNPYASLHPGFQNYPSISFQPPNILSNPLPPSTSAFPFIPLPSQPPPVLHITPFVPFAALSDPIKLFDGLDRTYPPEKFLVHLSARVTFQLGHQPLDIQ